jgi:hypothetical protein
MRDAGSSLSEQKARGVRLISHTDDVSRPVLTIRNSRTTPAVSDFQILSPLRQGLQHDDSTFPGADHGVHRTGGTPVLPTASGADGLTVSPTNVDCDEFESDPRVVRRGLGRRDLVELPASIELGLRARAGSTVLEGLNSRACSWALPTQRRGRLRRHPLGARHGRRKLDRLLVRAPRDPQAP